MPLLVEPMPPLRESRFSAPDDAQEASYFAASARISSFCSVDSMFMLLFLSASQVKPALEEARIAIRRLRESSRTRQTHAVSHSRPPAA